MHVQTRTSTQARSHAQKFFVKIEKKNLTLEDYLNGLDFSNLDADILFSDLEDEDNSGGKQDSSEKTLNEVVEES